MEENLDIEEFDEVVDLKGPFDPNKIKVDIATVNLGYLLEQLKYDEIDLKPEFQRNCDVWDKSKKSRLIESLLLGLPLPSFYFSEDPKTQKFIIIDGLQRLCAFNDFFIKEGKDALVLQDLQFLKDLEGKRFKDLDRTQVRKIYGLKITTNTLSKETPINVKYIIFQRVNSAGVPLKQQEMRNALYQGRATKLLRSMVELDNFRLATCKRVKSDRMVDCDFANRFLAFYLKFNEFDGSLDTLMSNTLEFINNDKTISVDEILKKFDISMYACSKILGNKAFRRPNPKKKGQYMQTNKSLFDCISVSFAKLQAKELDCLVNNKDKFNDLLTNLFEDTKFVDSITAGTSKLPQVEYRYEKIQEIINKIIQK